MFKVRVSVGFVASASIRTAFSTLYFCNAIAFGLFFYKQSAVNVVCTKPGLEELDHY